MTRSVTRKDFLILSAASAGAFIAAACSSDSETPSGGGAGPGGSTGTGGSAGSGVAGSSTTGGTAGKASTGGVAGKASTGGTAGKASTGGTAGKASTGGTAGKASTGGTGGKGGAGGTTGSGGSGGSAGGKAGGGCGTVTITQPSNPSSQHTHVSVVTGTILTATDVTKLKTDLAAHINGSMATMEFTLPADGPTAPGHTHKITLTATEVTTLLGGGMVTGKVSTTDASHSHTYTIGCSA